MIQSAGPVEEMLPPEPSFVPRPTLCSLHLTVHGDTPGRGETCVMCFGARCQKP